MAREKAIFTPVQIKNLRNKGGWTQERFAARIGATFGSVSRWENGRTKPSRMACDHIRRVIQEDFREWRNILNEIESGSGTVDKPSGEEQAQEGV